MRYLVTGASGFIGHAVAARALEAGDEVHLSVRRPDAANVVALAGQGAVVHVGEVGDPNAIAEAARGAEVVVHAAGIAQPGQDPNAYAWANVAGTENVLTAARHVGVRRVVVLSSANVTLHAGRRVNWNEGHALPHRPFGALARSKLLAEELGLAASGADTEVTVVRPARVWGTGDTSWLPRLLQEAREGGVRIPGSGDTLFDTAHVDGVVDAVLAAAEESGAAGRTYLVADGAMESVTDFFTELLRAVGAGAPQKGWPIPVARAMARFAGGASPGGLTEDELLERAFDTAFDTQRARTELHWAPTADRSAAFEALARWHRDHRT